MYVVEPFRMHCLVACPGNRPELNAFDRRSNHLFFFFVTTLSKPSEGTTDHLPWNPKLKSLAPSSIRDDHHRSKHRATDPDGKMLTTGHKSNDHLE